MPFPKPYLSLSSLQAMSLPAHINLELYYIIEMDFVNKKYKKINFKYHEIDCRYYNLNILNLSFLFN